MFRAYHLSVFVVIFIVNLTTAVDVTIVDHLTADYLRAEKNLWKVVERRESNALDQIYDVHSQYLNRDFGETNVILNRTYVKALPQLVIDAVIEIKKTSHHLLDAIYRHRITNEQAKEGGNLQWSLAAIMHRIFGGLRHEFEDELLKVRNAVCQQRKRNAKFREIFAANIGRSVQIRIAEHFAKTSG